MQIDMITPKDYIGPLMELAQDRRGEFKEMKFITENRASITYHLPLAEVASAILSPLHRLCEVLYSTYFMLSLSLTHTGIPFFFCWPCLYSFTADNLYLVSFFRWSGISLISSSPEVKVMLAWNTLSSGK